MQACLLTLTSAPSFGRGELPQAHCLRERSVSLLFREQNEVWSAKVEMCIPYTRMIRSHTWPVEETCCTADKQFDGLERVSDY